MSFSSCIKIPVSKQCMSPDRSTSNGTPRESQTGTYNELVSIANEVFGQGNWSHAVTSQTVDFVEYVLGKYQVGCAAFVRVQLTDGTFHEELGYSNAEASTKGSAVASARVSSITHALKKSLLCFGKIMEERINKMVVMKKNKQRSMTYDTPTSSDNHETEKLDVKPSPSKTASKRSKSPVEAIVADVPEILDDIDDEINQPAKKHRAETPDTPSVKCLIASSTNDDKAKVTGETAQASKPTTTAMTEEELRLERKRKQKLKQEEFRKLMREKESKSDDKQNPKF